MASSFDIIVCGGGTAGSVAAIRAARLGLRTAIVERQSQLGGSSTAGLVTPQMANRCAGKDLVGGIARELRESLSALGYGQGRGFDPVWTAILLEEFARRDQVALFYHCELIGVARDDKRLTGVELAGLGKRIELQSSYFVDATGDAILSMLAGEPTEQGRQGNREHQPMTLRFVLGNVDVEQALAFVRKQEPEGVRSIWPCSDQAQGGPVSVNLKWLQAAAVQWGQLKRWEDQLYFHFYTVPGKPDWAAFNAPRIIQYDPADPASLAEAYADGRSQIVQYWRFFREHVPGFANCYIAQIAPMMGIRECRRIKGKFVLEERHVRSLSRFDDAVCLCNYPIDIHSNRDASTEIWRLPADSWYEIPYRAMLPARTENLIVAGRCISTDFSTHSSYRIMNCCQALGEAAAYACQAANSQNKTLPAIDGAALNKRLIQDEVLLRPTGPNKESTS